MNNPGDLCEVRIPVGVAINLGKTAKQHLALQWGPVRLVDDGQQWNDCTSLSNRLRRSVHDLRKDNFQSRHKNIEQAVFPIRIFLRLPLPSSLGHERTPVL